MLQNSRPYRLGENPIERVQNPAAQTLLPLITS